MRDTATPAYTRQRFPAVGRFRGVICLPASPCRPLTPREPSVPASPLSPRTPGAAGADGSPAGPRTPSRPCSPLSPFLPLAPSSPSAPSRPATSGKNSGCYCAVKMCTNMHTLCLTTVTALFGTVKMHAYCCVDMTTATNIDKQTCTPLYHQSHGVLAGP